MGGATPAPRAARLLVSKPAFCFHNGMQVDRQAYLGCPGEGLLSGLSKKVFAFVCSLPACKTTFRLRFSVGLLVVVVFIGGGQLGGGHGLWHMPKRVNYII